MYILDPALEETNDNMGHETSADTYCDAIGEGHENDGQEGRNSDSVILPIDLFDLRHHQEANDDESRCRCFVRDDRNKRCDEGGQQEEDSCDNRGETGSSTFANARCTLDI